ncbi:MAG TPA: hypothetical protein DCQ31_01870 [Bacteroidales bacterium]|nr:hypothetical protein [Bacteroidales bacterium]
MKKILTCLKYALAILFFIFSFGCNPIKPLELEDIESLSIKQMSFSYLDVEVKLPVKNPNSFSFKITKINLDASINGMHVGTITEQQIIPISANKKETITLPLRVQTKDLLSGALNLFLNYSEANSKLKLYGTIEVKIWVFSKTISINQETQMVRPKTTN